MAAQYDKLLARSDQEHKEIATLAKPADKYEGFVSEEVMRKPKSSINDPEQPHRTRNLEVHCLKEYKKRDLLLGLNKMWQSLGLQSLNKDNNPDVHMLV